MCFIRPFGNANDRNRSKERNSNTLGKQMKTNNGLSIASWFEVLCGFNLEQSGSTGADIVVHQAQSKGEEWRLAYLPLKIIACRSSCLGNKWW